MSWEKRRPISKQLGHILACYEIHQERYQKDGIIKLELRTAAPEAILQPQYLVERLNFETPP
jgi:hypothetical protein